MSNIDENRVEKFIKKHAGYKKWLAAVLCLALTTGAVTLYILNKPAVATTTDTAENEVGIIFEDSNDSNGNGDPENGQVTEETDNEIVTDAGQVVEQESTVDTDKVVSTDDGGNTGTATVVNEDGTSDSNSTEITQDDASDVASSEDSSESSDAASSSSSSDLADSSSSVASSATSQVDLETVNEVTLTATLIDEFGVEIDTDNYSGIALPDFDSELVLNDPDVPPYSDVKVKTGLLKYSTYSYVKATIGSKVITGIKKETVESALAETDDASDNAASYAETEGSSAETKSVTVYSYTTDGSSYTRIEEDTVINFVYSLGTQAEYEYSDNNISITAKLQVPGAIPDEAELVVTLIDQSTEGYNYDAYMEALNNSADEIASEAGLEDSNKYDSANTLMYDIAFMYEGEEIQPAEGSVSISVEFKNKQLTNELSVTSEEDITVVHLPIKEEVKEASEITTTQEATDITSDDIEVKTLTDATAEVADTEKIEFSEDSFSIFAVTVYQSHDAGTDDFESVLGDAVNFGIVSDKFEVGESETNFATQIVVANSHSGNDLTNPTEQTFMAGAISGNLEIKGLPAYFIVPSDYSSQVTHLSGASYLKLDTAYTTKEINAVIDDMMEYVMKASTELASREDTATLVYNSVSQKYSVDITSYAPGTYYVTLDATDMANISQSDKLRIYKNSDQTIVFNVTASSTVYLQKYSVSTDGGALIGADELAKSKDYTSVTQSIIWNFINAGEVLSSGSVSGVFISGNEYAIWDNYSTSSGWLVFPTVRIYSGEWHNTYDKVKQISGTAQFQAYKNVDGEYSTVTGFKFTLYKQDTTAEDGWTAIQTVGNDEDTPHNVTFNAITYGNNSSKASDTNYQYTSVNTVGGSESFIYKIAETSGTTDSEGNSYNADETVYYAKVTVTLLEQNEATKSTYYHVSAPVYYTDEACTIEYTDDDLPVFNNTSIEGSIGISLSKYLNGEDPGDLQFEFTVRILNSDGTLTTLTDELTNDGSNISYTFDYNGNNIIYDSQKNDRIYLVVTENDISTSSSSSSFKLTKDSDYIIIRVDHPGSDDQNIYYFRYDSDDSTEKGYIDNIESGDPSKIMSAVASAKTKKSANKISDASDIAFYNTGTGNLRIHKIVVNDFGSGFVRDNTGSALLSNVKFRITNNSSGNYIVFTGFTGKAGNTGTAIEYDATSHQPTGNTYTVTYNQSAQWTISDLPAGTYTVDEVADGLTFTYDESTNTSTVIEECNLSRVTKYDVTVDDEETGKTGYGTGGENYRKVFSVDLTNHSDLAPTNVKVGSPDVDNASHTQTVQVCNYYSIPIGPIQVAKNFSGGVWDDDMVFTFKIEGTGYTAYTSEGEAVTLTAQPMPEASAKGSDGTYTTTIEDTVTVTSEDAVLNADGTYTAIAQFEAIPFKYEGTYYYKITEVDTKIDGVKYDTSEYYVKIVVSKKYTTFSKTYTYEKMTHPEGYTSDTTLSEDFYYLGADVTYASDKDFLNVLAECELYLGTEPDTSTSYNNAFTVNYKKGSVYEVDFNNTLTGNLTVTKKWLDSAGNDASASHTSLTLYIWQRVAGSSEWSLYGSTQLSSDNGWSQQITGLPIKDSSGNTYEYCIKESDNYIDTYSVIYTYNGTDYYANAQEDIQVSEGEQKKVYRDTGYSMSLGTDGMSFGEVTITNKSVVTNTLPSTGGIGTYPAYIFGLLLMLIACMGLLITKVNFIKGEEK